MEADCPGEIELCICVETVGNIVNAQTEDSLVIFLLTHVSTGHISALELFSLEGVFN